MRSKSQIITYLQLSLNCQTVSKGNSNDSLCYAFVQSRLCSNIDKYEPANQIIGLERTAFPLEQPSWTSGEEQTQTPDTASAHWSRFIFVFWMNPLFYQSGKLIYKGSDVAGACIINHILAKSTWEFLCRPRIMGFSKNAPAYKMFCQESFVSFKEYI